MAKETWFRLYVEWAFDPKIQSLDFETQRHHLMVLCLKKNGDLEKFSGKTLENIIGCALRVSPKKLGKIKKSLIEATLINENWEPNGWDDRQYISDEDPTHKERQRRYRERKTKSDRSQVRHGDDEVTESDGSKVCHGDGKMTESDGSQVRHGDDQIQIQKQIQNNPPTPQGGDGAVGPEEGGLDFGTKQPAQSKTRPIKIKPGEYPAEFEAIWASYGGEGSKGTKGDACAAYRARGKEGWEPEEIAQAVKTYAEHCAKNRRYIQHLSTLLGKPKGIDTPRFAEWINGPGDMESPAPGPKLKTPEELEAYLKASQGRLTREMDDELVRALVIESKGLKSLMETLEAGGLGYIYSRYQRMSRELSHAV